MNPWQTLPHDWSATPVRLGLHRIRHLVDALGLRPWPFTAILVTGTNGKGSTCAFLHEILRAHGVLSGLYTSPHLQRPEERVRLGDAEVSSEELETTWRRVVALCEQELQAGRLDEPPTFFEILTAVALDIFARRSVTVAILEIGMGGRYDATNVVDPTVSVITHIDYDHENFLGHRLIDIAEEKFGIARPGVPLVTGERRHWLLDLWARRLGAWGSPFVPVYTRTVWEVRHRWGHYRLRAEAPEWSLPWTPLALAGGHQVENALLATWGAYFWFQRQGRALDMACVQAALGRTTWPGRLEWWSHPQAPPVLLDGAHNRDGIRRCVEYLRLQPYDRWTILFGCMQDKPWVDMLRLLQPLGDWWAWTPVPGSERSWAPAQHTDYLRALGFQDGDVLEPSAIPDFLKSARTPVLVVGSLYLVGWVRARLPELGYRRVVHPSLAEGATEFDT